jgi:hypothetical protein
VDVIEIKEALHTNHRSEIMLNAEKTRQCLLLLVLLSLIR